MKVVVAPNPFKGSLTAAEAAEAMARGVRAAGSQAEIVPVADGGEGTLDALVQLLGGTVMGIICRGPLGLPVRAHIARLADGTGVVEMAQASGIGLVPERDRDPLRASSYGTGEAIRAALSRRPRRLIVALGGTATVDGGTGIGMALGVRFLDEAGRDLPDGGGSLERLARIDTAGLDARLNETELIAAADVEAPLGAAATVFAAQKGAGPAEVSVLARGLQVLAGRLAEDLDANVEALPGAGAAGGAGALLAALGASVRPGIEVVLEAAGFAQRLEGAGLVLTGEGHLDAQTAFGKGPLGVARAAKAAGVPCVVLAGVAEKGEAGIFTSVRTLTELYEGDRGRAMRAAAEGLAALARDVVRERISTR